MPAKSRRPEQPGQPTFIFKGTVQKLKGATMSQVPVDDRTIVATVDQVLEAPANLAKLAGQQITVRLAGTAKIKTGQQLIFNTVSWIYGDSVAVQSLSQEPVSGVRMASLGAAGDPVKRRAARQKRERFAAADLVVTGRVLAVRLPPESGPKTRGIRAAALTSAGAKPISEHDPKWREAVVEVGDVHKGSHRKKEVVVRFPASMDVMWYHAPKFHPGQQGYFMLQKAGAETTPSAGKKSAARASALTSRRAGQEAYVALDPIDFQPFNEPGGVNTISNASGDDPDQ
ncbi:MAG: copper resistance protein [Blastocatellia bacterium]|jgi:hypothetical protein|nr:copper resistance protein [Blastocatellia bacterium]